MYRARPVRFGLICAAAASLVTLLGPAAYATTAAHPKPTVAFLGDSYTAGTGDPQYWRTTSKLMCWDALNFGRSGTGYVNPGKKAVYGVFGQRVENIVEAHPSIVIVQGSFNDKKTTDVEPAAHAVLEELRERLPSAEIFAMSPVYRPKKDSTALVNANTAAVHKAATEVGVPFIDARTFIKVDPSLYRRDLLHPNAKGHLALGKKLAAVLPKRLNAC
ncbi:MAG: SGNH/GDSL hydrolase family protein [Nocardiaceae bacterium]|nr:SGNH/GDSL hydrolase family protein [Nocardiaceae bacterium]